MSQAMTSKYDFDVGKYRPPSEGGQASLLLQITRNCPWNHCEFCRMYKESRFELRSVSEIKQDIDAVAAIQTDLSTISQEIGNRGRITHAAINTMISRAPELNYHQGFAVVCHWLLSGGGTVFLQDANSLIMRTDRLVEVLTYLRSVFASIGRVTTYARSKTILRKSHNELVAIRQAGLDRLHVGLESGDDTLLKRIRKGALAQQHIKGGRKALAAGFQLSEYWMPGLGGKAMWRNHAINTAQVLNNINPDYIRSRPFRPIAGTEMYEEVQQGRLQMLTAREQLLELELMIKHLDVTSKVCFDHAGNYWRNRQGRHLFSHSYEGYQFPQEKNRVLAAIEEGLAVASHPPSSLL